MDMFLTFIAFIIVLGILVFVHELGHFLTAKLFKVKVLEFALGFPPRVFSFKKNETKYSIGLIPFGGYVKMLGEDETSTDPRAYNNQTAGKRFIIGIAGVVMNILLAWIILTAGFINGMTPMATPSSEVPGQSVKPQIFIVEVVKDSPAEKAGLTAGDIIIKGTVDSNETTFSSAESVSEFTTTNSGKEATFSLKRSEQTLEKKIILSSDKSESLGVGIINQSIVKVTWYKAPVVALRETYNIISITFDFIRNFFTKLFSTGKLSDQVGGPVAIYSLSGQAARSGAVVFIQFIAMLSINLALLNILPFPALDGGRALFVLLEKIFGKRIVKEDVENIIHTIGFLLLIALAIAVTYKDVVRLIAK